MSDKETSSLILRIILFKLGLKQTNVKINHGVSVSTCRTLVKFYNQYSARLQDAIDLGLEAIK